MFCVPLAAAPDATANHRTALNYAKVFGMEKAMNLHGQQFAMVSLLFLPFVPLLTLSDPLTGCFHVLHRIHGSTSPLGIPHRSLPSRSGPRRLYCHLGRQCTHHGCKQELHAYSCEQVLPRVREHALPSDSHITDTSLQPSVFEASVTPGLSLMTGFWYTRAEAPLRQTIWYSAVGFGGMIGSLMAAGISQ